MITIEQLRTYAKEAEEFLGNEIHKFVDFIEGKHAPEAAAPSTPVEGAAAAAGAEAPAAPAGTPPAPETSA